MPTEFELRTAKYWKEYFSNYKKGTLLALLLGYEHEQKVIAAKVDALRELVKEKENAK